MLVREGFSWGALLFGPIWLLVQRAWIPAALAWCVWIGGRAAARTAGRRWCCWRCIGCSGLVGRDLLRWSLGLRGFLLEHVVAATNEDAALAACWSSGPIWSAGDGRVKVAVVDYGSGNLASASRALMLAASREGIAAEVEITADPDRVATADRIVLPGQGAFADCAQGLAAISGLEEAIFAATDAGKPFLGICVGMQLMSQRGLEHKITPGFGWIAGDVAAMTPPDRFACRKWAGTSLYSSRAHIAAERRRARGPRLFRA